MQKLIKTLIIILITGVQVQAQFTQEDLLEWQGGDGLESYMIKYLKSLEVKPEIYVYLEEHNTEGAIIKELRNSKIIEKPYMRHISLTETGIPSDILDTTLISQKQKKVSVKYRGYNSRGHWSMNHPLYLYMLSDKKIEAEIIFRDILKNLFPNPNMDLWQKEGWHTARKKFNKEAQLLYSNLYKKEIITAQSTHHVDATCLRVLYEELINLEKQKTPLNNVLIHIDGGGVHPLFLNKILSEWGYKIKVFYLSKKTLIDSYNSLSYDLFIDPSYERYIKNN